MSNENERQNRPENLQTIRLNNEPEVLNGLSGGNNGVENSNLVPQVHNNVNGNGG